jgi:hypothetical protein
MEDRVQLPMANTLGKVLTHIDERVRKREQPVVIIGLLSLLLVSIFSISLHFIPAQGDDLRLLSSVADTKNPLKYFGSDAGEGKREYRPLFSIPLWCAYKFFGVKATTNQLVNLILHFINVLLLFRIISRVQTDDVLLFLVAAIFLVSINTVSPASWVADRPTLLVGLFLLLAIDHLLISDTTCKIRVWYLATLSFLALMSKESGLIVILFTLLGGLRLSIGRRLRTELAIASFVVIISYLGLRYIVFSAQPASNVDIGYGPGIIYDNWVSALSPELNVTKSVKTVLTNLTASVLPIFNWEGEILPTGIIVKQILIWLPTALIFWVSWSRRLTTLQKYALFIIALNSTICFVAFRYRLQYLSWIGVCTFIAASPTTKISVNNKIALRVLASILLLSSTYTINRQLHDDWLRRYEDLNKDELRREVYDHRLFGKIDNEIVKQILDMYKK